MKHTDLQRRRFLGSMLQQAGVATLAGMGLFALQRQSRALPAQALRPPGALAETDFLAACIRCGLCVRACPYDTLRLADFAGDVPPGTPFFEARTVPCEMCEDIPCQAACPTGALSPELQDIDDARMGLAVLLDTENCIAFQGLRCEVCFNVCPLQNQAIRLELQHNTRTGKHARFIPTVRADACTGCGKCEHACILEEPAIKVLPTELARGSRGTHYRLGWKEKEHAGHSLVTPDPEHHYHLPEGYRYEYEGQGLIGPKQPPGAKQPPFADEPLETLNGAHLKDGGRNP